MTRQVKDGTSLFRYYDLLVLQKIRDSKPSSKPLNKRKVQPEAQVDDFGQMIYHFTFKSQQTNHE